MLVNLSDKEALEKFKQILYFYDEDAKYDQKAISEGSELIQVIQASSTLKAI